MNLNEYQQQAAGTAVYQDQKTVDGLTYAILALCGEAGELANKLKKHLRAGTPVDADVLADELGDVLWYVSAVAKELGRTLDSVADQNLRKLAARKAANKITG